MRNDPISMKNPTQFPFIPGSRQRVPRRLVSDLDRCPIGESRRFDRTGGSGIPGGLSGGINPSTRFFENMIGESISEKYISISVD